MGAERSGWKDGHEEAVGERDAERPHHHQEQPCLVASGVNRYAESDQDD